MVPLTAEEKPAAPAPTISRWDPFSAFREFMRWPVRALASITTLDHFDDSAPSLGVEETTGASFQTDLASVEERDLTGNLSGNRLYRRVTRSGSSTRPNARIAGTIYGLIGIALAIQSACSPRPLPSPPEPRPWTQTASHPVPPPPARTTVSAESPQAIDAGLGGR